MSEDSIREQIAPNFFTRKLFAILFLIGVLSLLSSSFLMIQLQNNAVAAMQSIIEMDAALIGFLAIIAIFLMTASQTDSRRIRSRLLREDKLHDLNVKRNLSNDAEYSSYKKRKYGYSYFLGYYSGFPGTILITSVVSAVFFVASVFGALMAMGVKSGTFYERLGIVISVYSMFIGITFIFLVLFYYKRVEQKLSDFDFECLVQES